MAIISSIYLIFVLISGKFVLIFGIFVLIFRIFVLISAKFLLIFGIFVLISGKFYTRQNIFHRKSGKKQSWHLVRDDNRSKISIVQMKLTEGKASLKISSVLSGKPNSADHIGN